MKLGIDLGSSAAKLVTVESGVLLETRYLPRITDPNEALETAGLRLDGLEQIALTGLNSEKADKSRLPAPCRTVLETESIARGASAMAGTDQCIVVNIGTGTAFLEVSGEQIRHLGGTGVGGGTLTGFARLLGLAHAAELTDLALLGDYTKVDLTIGDLYSGDRDLDPRLTASNLARLTKEASREDLAAGLCNLVLQVIGTVSLFAARGAGKDCVVVTGGAAGSELARKNFDRFETCYGLRYLVPEQEKFATAYGAVLLV